MAGRDESGTRRAPRVRRRSEPAEPEGDDHAAERAALVAGLDTMPEDARYVLRRAIELARRRPSRTTLRDLHRATRDRPGLGATDDLRPIVGGLAERGYLRLTRREPGRRGGRPTERIELHPALAVGSITTLTKPTKPTEPSLASTTSADPGASVEPGRATDAGAADPGGWDGRVLLGMYLDRRRWRGWPALPAKAARKQRAAAERLAANPRWAIVAAMVGMEALFPFADPPAGEAAPWDLVDLEKHLAKAVVAARKHPRAWRERLTQRGETGGTP